MHLPCQQDEAGIEGGLPFLIGAPGCRVGRGGAVTTDVVRHGVLLKSKRTGGGGRRPGISSWPGGLTTGGSGGSIGGSVLIPVIPAERVPAFRRHNGTTDDDVICGFLLFWLPLSSSRPGWLSFLLNAHFGRCYALCSSPVHTDIHLPL